MLSPTTMACLKALVDTNTATDNIAGLDAARIILVNEFAKVGLVPKAIDGDHGRKVLAFEVPGAIPKIALIGHLDTVFPKQCSFQKLEARDTRLTGPGVIDMKGGIILALDIVRAFAESDVLQYLRVIINDDEETGSAGSAAILHDLARDVPFGLIYEPGLPDGSVITSHSGVRWYKLSVRGKPAHAGLEPTAGINACTELCEKIGKVVALNDHQRGLTLSPGLIQGGTRTNVVCEHAHALIDVRFPGEQNIGELDQQLRSIASTMYTPSSAGAAVGTVEVFNEMPPMPKASTKVIFEHLRTVAERLGQSVSGHHVGYASDGNHLAQTGMSLLVGLGPYGNGMHADTEYMLVESYAKRLALNLGLIRSLAATL